MKKIKITKIITSLLIVVALSPATIAHAQWKADNIGWKYTENSTPVYGWKYINENWYYFNTSGYMVRNDYVEGYYLGTDGAWTTNIPVKTSATANETDFDFDSSTGTIKKYKGENTKHVQLVIPNTIKGVQVKIIGERSFEGYDKLDSITIPEGVIEIQGLAFFRCSELLSITIPNGVKTIGYGSFAGCNSLKEMVITSSVVSIGDWAFDACHDLVTLTIPQNAKLEKDSLSGLNTMTNIVRS